MRRSPSLHWSPSGGCWGGATLSVCPGKVGGEWLAEVYGDLWPLPQHLIASSSVGSRGRPMESFDQHQGSCRWAHQIRCLLRLITETNGVTESSATRRHTKIRKTMARRRTAGQWKGLGLQLGLQVGGEGRRIMGTLASLVPIYHWEVLWWNRKRKKHLNLILGH